MDGPVGSKGSLGYALEAALPRFITAADDDTDRKEPNVTNRFASLASRESVASWHSQEKEREKYQ
jgi:hypothetical protein